MERCKVCGSVIRVMAYLGTGACGQRHYGRPAEPIRVHPSVNGFDPNVIALKPIDEHRRQGW